MNYKEFFNDTLTRYPKLRASETDISLAFELLTAAFEKGNKLLLAGNGGSCADCDHIVGELMKSFLKKRPISGALKEALLSDPSEIASTLATHLEGALPAISLCEHGALGSAVQNDVSARLIYAQKLLGFAKAGDVLLLISTSGNSENCLYAATLAKALGVRTIAFTGKSGGKLKSVCDVSVCVDESETYKVQELHLPLYHCLCAMLEDYFF